MLRRSTNRLQGIAGASCLLAWALIAGCADGGSRQCFDNSECASGLCLSDGTCATGPDAGSRADADPTAPDADIIAGCQPNHDGVIARDEILLAAGRSASFRVATDVVVDTAGQLQSGGGRSWDFLGPFSGDSDLLVELTPVAGTWYADSFPTASYATRLSVTEELLGVFEITDTQLLLLGVVSPEAGLSRTELEYDPPVAVLELPLSPSSTWSTTSTVSGLAQGVYTLYTEEYVQRVDAIGDIDTPFGTFPVQRVEVDLTRTVGAAVVTLRSFSFVSECYGIVAQVSSNEYESADEFTDAAELRRMAP